MVRKIIIAACSAGAILGICLADSEVDIMPLIVASFSGLLLAYLWK